MDARGEAPVFCSALVREDDMEGALASCLVLAGENDMVEVLVSCLALVGEGEEEAAGGRISSFRNRTSQVSAGNNLLSRCRPIPSRNQACTTASSSHLAISQVEKLSTENLSRSSCNRSRDPRISSRRISRVGDT